MRHRTTVAAVAVGIITLALLLSTTSYAKLVVLSYNFNNDNAGFSPATSSNCGANFNINPSANGLAVNSPAPAACAGTFEIDKLVVLSPIGHPSFEVTVVDPGNNVNTGSSAVMFNGQTYSLSWDTNGNRKHGTANLGTLNAAVTIRVLIRFNSGTRNFVINNVILNSN